jgi:hypothetical protein
MLLAELDIGTTGCKLTAYSPEGAYLGRCIRTILLNEVDKAVYEDTRKAIRLFSQREKA